MCFDCLVDHRALFCFQKILKKIKYSVGYLVKNLWTSYIKLKSKNEILSVLESITVILLKFLILELLLSDSLK